MPFYEYECASCKSHTEALQKINDPPLRKCPSCGRNTLRKLVSAPNFRLKGGGWYETDFKSDKENKRNLAVEKEPEAKAPEVKPAADKAADTKPVEAKPAEPKEPAGRTRSGNKSATAAKKPAARKSQSKSKAKAGRRSRR